LASSLLLMPCSGGKLAHAAPAGDLYTGVMWQSLRAHATTPLRMAILSAKYGVVAPSDVIAPYEQRLDVARAQELLDDLAVHVATARRVIGDAPVDHVFIAGGQPYRRVLLAIVSQLQAHGGIDAAARVEHTHGGIGFQRSQLGAYLRARAPDPAPDLAQRPTRNAAPARVPH
jgi:hypothetical protein